MTKIYNQRSFKELRRKLRKEPIGAERVLWFKLKNKQTGYKFRRQHSIGCYIIDFYCPKLKLAVELDGSTHSNKKEIENDKIREQYLKKYRITIIRFLNSEVYNHTDLVIEKIIEVCDELNVEGVPH